MAITIEPAPDGLDDLVAERLRLVPPRTGHDVDSSLLFLPLPVHSAAAKDLVRADGEIVPGLRRTGWRMLIDEGGYFATADISDGEESLEIQGVFRGDLAAALATATRTAADLETGDYDASILDLREIGIVALRLQAAQGPSLAVPLTEGEEAPIAMSVLASVIRKLAQHRLTG